MKVSVSCVLKSSAALMLLLSGCKSFDEYQQDRIAYAVKHFEQAQYCNIPSGQTLTLNDCVRMAVKNNLDLKVFGLEEQVAKDPAPLPAGGRHRGPLNRAPGPPPRAPGRRVAANRCVPAPLRGAGTYKHKK